MARRKLAAEIKPQKHFKASSVSSNMGMGTRKMALLAPFVISGGKNTERFYFQHISRNIKELRVIPEYFGKESSYTSFFPEKINKILKDNNEAKIFCVFDWDTIYGNKTNLEKHNRFVKQIRSFIDDDRVILCPSMPCFEYWFLLHFKNTTKFVGTCEEIAKMLKPYMNAYFSQKDINLFEVLKDRNYLEKETWVKNLCSNGKLDNAIKRAEDNIKAAIKADDLENQSYSYVYKVFK
ncbi:MAG: RloB domain-containing protein [Prevotella sp.]|nr:RloB domain-containing protein [Prevotella sp.]